MTDPRAAAIFVNSRLRRMLAMFIGAPRSVGDVARAANIDLRTLHYHVGNFVCLGLVEVTSLVPRAGRPIKYYQAVADAFLVSDAVVPRPFGEQLARELRDSLANHTSSEDGGLLLTAGEHGEPLLRAVGGRAAGCGDIWTILRLSPADVTRFEREVRALLDGLRASAGDGGSVYLVNVAFARRADQGGPVDNPY